MTAYMESSAGGETIDEDAKYSREERTRRQGKSGSPRTGDRVLALRVVQSLVLLQIFDCSLGGVSNRLTVVVQQRDQTRQRFLRVKSLERLDRRNAHRRTLIVESVKQRPDGTSITDLSHAGRLAGVAHCVKVSAMPSGEAEPLALRLERRR